MPSGKIQYPSSEKLSFLLELIHNREMALPDFQRDFVWDPRATEELIESICQNFPAGSLLRIKNTAGFYFTPREVAGAPELDRHKPSYLVLDGQQRLTSLYQAFFGAGDHLYFIDFKRLIGGDDLEDCVFFERRKKGEKRYGTLQQQAETLVFPFQSLFGGSGGFEEWLDQVLDLRDEIDEDKSELKTQLRAQQKEWLRTVEDYEFPVVTLSEDTSASAVCTIFETLNRTGVKLSVFDLLAARFWPEEVRLRHLWEEARETYPIIAEFDVDPYYVLQGVAILTSRAAPSCKRGDVLSMDVDQIREGWAPTVQGLADFLQILRDDCGVIVPRWLPYTTILIPGAATLAFGAEMTGPEVAAARAKIRRWFWCSVFKQTYENAPNSQAAKDYQEIRAWIDGGDPPETIADFAFDPAVLKETTPRQRALYRGVMALIVRSGALDFHTGDQINAGMVIDKKIDDHHVFPQGYLLEHVVDAGRTKRNGVLNRTLIDRITNIKISDRAPSNYLGDIGSAIGSKELERVLDTHLLPSATDGPLWTDDFETFLEARLALITAQVEEVTKTRLSPLEIA